jgi:hypothetical protein
MDSQAKYCCLARGEGGVYFRMPKEGAGYREKIWVSFIITPSRIPTLPLLKM